MDSRRAIESKTGLEVMICTGHDALYADLRDYLTDRGLTVVDGPVREPYVPRDQRPDCLVLDAATVRLDPPPLPNPDCGVLILAAAGEPVERKIAALECGADDYIDHPVNPRELLARIRAVHRGRRVGASKATTPTTYVFASFALDATRRILSDHRGRSVTLSRSAFLLLKCFLDNPHRVLGRVALAEAVGVDASDASDRAIDVQVSRLRSQLRANGRDLINTIYGEGYQFVASVQRGAPPLARG